jgi:hypothetical protein
MSSRELRVTPDDLGQDQASSMFCYTDFLEFLELIVDIRKISLKHEEIVAGSSTIYGHKRGIT